MNPGEPLYSFARLFPFYGPIPCLLGANESHPMFVIAS